MRLKKLGLIGLYVVIFSLAALALVTKIGADRAEEAHPPIGEFASVDGIRLHFKDAGVGPTVVLIHGAGTSLIDFEVSIAEPLRRSHRVITVDRPGHGYSERPDGGWQDPAGQARLIHDVLVQRGVDSPVLVGHSWGASVVLAYLLAHPDAAAGGVLLAGVSHPWESDVAWYNELAGVPILGDLFTWTMIYPFGQQAMGAAIKRAFDPNPVPAGYLHRSGIGLSFRPSAFSGNAEDVRRLSDFLMVQSQRYADILHPLLLVTGADDRIVPSRNHADRLERQIDDVQRIDLENTGHLPHHVRPGQVAAAIERFVSAVGGKAD